MSQAATILGSALFGSLVTLLVKHYLDRGTESRTARRDVYHELLVVLSNRRRETERLSFAWRDQHSPDLDEDRLDTLEAKLQADASPEVRRLADRCFTALHQFWNSYTLRAPAELDEHGLFVYRFDLMRNKPDEAQDVVMRVALSRLHGELGASIDATAIRIRRELHGRAAGRH